MGGDDYRKMKQELDELNTKISADEKLLIQNKATIEGSIENLRKLDGKIEEAEQKLE